MSNAFIGCRVYVDFFLMRRRRTGKTKSQRNAKEIKATRKQNSRLYKNRLLCLLSTLSAQRWLHRRQHQITAEVNREQLQVSNVRNEFIDNTINRRLFHLLRDIGFLCNSFDHKYTIHTVCLIVIAFDKRQKNVQLQIILCNCNGARAHDRPNNDQNLHQIRFLGEWIIDDYK